MPVLPQLPSAAADPLHGGGASSARTLLAHSGKTSE